MKFTSKMDFTTFADSVKEIEFGITRSVFVAGMKNLKQQIIAGGDVDLGFTEVTSKNSYGHFNGVTDNDLPNIFTDDNSNNPNCVIVSVYKHGTNTLIGKTIFIGQVGVLYKLFGLIREDMRFNVLPIEKEVVATPIIKEVTKVEEHKNTQEPEVRIDTKTANKSKILSVNPTKNTPEESKE